MRNGLLAAAGLAAILAAFPAQAAGFGDLQQYYNDQGEQVPAFPRPRFDSHRSHAAPALGKGEPAATYYDQGQQVPAFPGSNRPAFGQPRP